MDFEMSSTGASLEAATAEVSRIVGRSGHQPDGGTQPEAEESAMAPLVAENDIPAEPREAALWYAKHGIPVFPLYWPVAGGCSCGNPKCEDIGKHPLTPHGFKDATTDVAQVEAWWERWPKANIGMPTGSATKRIVGDTDPRNGGPEDREEIIQSYGPISDGAAEIRTGGGGRHMHWGWEEGPVPKGIAPGFDLKGDGGYEGLAAPPLRLALCKRSDLTAAHQELAILEIRIGV
jgi:hypothetical protein